MKKILNNHFFPFRYNRSLEKCLIEVYETNGLMHEYVKSEEDDTYEQYNITRKKLFYLEGQFVGYVTIVDDYFRNERIINLKLVEDAN